MNPMFVDVRKFRVGGHFFAVEVKPARVRTRELAAELDKTHYLTGLFGTSQVGVGIAKHAAIALQDEECLDAYSGLSGARQVVMFQNRVLSPMRDRMKVEGKTPAVLTEYSCERTDPLAEQMPDALATVAVTELGHETLLGQPIEPREQSQSGIEVEVVGHRRRRREGHRTVAGKGDWVGRSTVW